MTKKQKKWLAAAGIGAFLLLLAGAFLFIGRPLMELVSEPERFRQWAGSRGFWGKLAFVGMMAFQILVAVIPGEPLEIGAGYAFGAWEGTLLCLLGAVLGSALVFILVRRFGMKAVEVFFPRDKILRLGFLQNEKKLNLWVFIIFFIPGTPKDILAYFVGMTRMRFSAWLVISGIARLPSVVTSTIGGDALGMGNHLFAAIVFGITLVISAGGMYFYHRLCKNKNGG